MIVTAMKTDGLARHVSVPGGFATRSYDIASAPYSIATMGVENQAAAPPGNDQWRDAKDVLEAWWKRPEAVEDDGVEPPDRDTIRLAFNVAEQMRRSGAPAPDRVAPSGDGGIVFERRDGSLFQTIEVSADRRLEFSVFRDGLLVKSAKPTV